MNRRVTKRDDLSHILSYLFITPCLKNRSNQDYVNASFFKDKVSPLFSQLLPKLIFTHLSLRLCNLTKHGTLTTLEAESLQVLFHELSAIRCPLVTLDGKRNITLIEAKVNQMAQ